MASSIWMLSINVDNPIQDSIQILKKVVGSQNWSWGTITSHAPFTENCNYETFLKLNSSL